jgi:hypothetical protein
MGSIAKAKTARLSRWKSIRSRNIVLVANHSHMYEQLIVRTLIDSFPNTPEGREKQMGAIQENVEWARNENRAFLRQSLEVKLIGL